MGSNENLARVLKLQAEPSGSWEESAAAHSLHFSAGLLALVKHFTDEETGPEGQSSWSKPPGELKTGLGGSFTPGHLGAQLVLCGQGVTASTAPQEGCPIRLSPQVPRTGALGSRDGGLKSGPGPLESLMLARGRGSAFTSHLLRGFCLPGAGSLPLPEGHPSGR